MPARRFPVIALLLGLAACSAEAPVPEGVSAALRFEASGVLAVLRTDRPVALLRTEFLTPYSRGPGAEEIECEFEVADAVLGATLILERTPGVTVIPNPWLKWAGARRLAHFPVLLPGREFTFRAPAGAAVKETALRVDYVELPPDASLLVLDEESVKLAAAPLGAPGAMEKGVLHRVSARYTTTTTRPANPDRRVALGSMEALALWPCARPAEDVAKWLAAARSTTVRARP